MRVTVLGGTGRLGKHLVDTLLSAGHHPVVVGRSAAAVTAPAGAEVVRGDVLDPDLMKRAVSGSEAVLTALSIPRATRSPFAAVVGPADLHSRSTKLLLEAMRTEGARRLVKVSAQGVGESSQLAGLGFRALVRHSNLRPAFEDHAVADSEIQGCSRDWTIVRPPILADGPSRGGVKAAEARRTWTWTRVAMVDVASWMVDALEDPDTFGRTLTLVPS